MTHIIIDSNEAWQQEKIRKALEKDKYDVSISNLPAGDFFIGGKREQVLVERKTSNDFASSLVDGRLWRQIKKLKEVAKEIDCEPILLIEGSLYRIMQRTKWRSYSAIIGAYESIRAKDGWNLSIVGPFPSDYWTIIWIKSKIKRDSKIPQKKIYALREMSPKHMSLTEQQRYILEGFPNIGPIMADRLLREFGSIAKVISAIKNGKIKKVKGVGEKLYKDLFDITVNSYKKKIK